MNQTMPIKKDDFSAALNNRQTSDFPVQPIIDEYLRDASPTGVIAPSGLNNNNFNSTIPNTRDQMNKTVNL